MTGTTNDGREDRIERAKWTLDDAETIEEMAQMLEQRAEELRELDEEGWELREPVQDDYPFLIPPDE